MLQAKTGLLKARFPVGNRLTDLPELGEWQKFPPPFFFYGKLIPGLKRNSSAVLKKQFEEIKEGTFTFFNRLKYHVGDHWHVNPDSGYSYDGKKHWTEIEDLSREAGDIKFVWEKARFSFLYDVIRYDYHCNDDCSEYVFSQIDSFIDSNPVNLGPHYKCSQEISLRILNWTFALYYYKDSPALCEDRFRRVLLSIYAQLHHVYENIQFSRISVRNNHAITETLMLYLSGLLFPFFPEARRWSEKGKKWFEEEIAYQIYEDGTFLQFSMNYHRVAIQLLTWGIRLTDLNGKRLAPIVYERAAQSLKFLDACLDPVSGKLPNYGANDGALFFKLTDDDYRVYTSQLNDLRAALNGKVSRDEESVHWYGISEVEQVNVRLQGTFSFDSSGYYIGQDRDVKTFIRSGRYKDRPSQSDNLHLDIWVDGENYLRDAGSYKYNTEDHLIHYFNGCEGHNTVSVSGYDQMLKGGRFVWFFWVKHAEGAWKKADGEQIFEGELTGFRHVKRSGYRHKRRVIRKEGEPRWTVWDEIQHNGKEKLHQFWHVNPQLEDRLLITSFDNNGRRVEPVREEKWYSGYYGEKERSIRLTFTTETNSFKTDIEILLPQPIGGGK